MSAATMSTEEYIDALRAIPANVCRDEWVRVGMAARSAGLTEDDFLQWSEPADSFNERDARAVWRSFDGEGVSAGTLVHFARQHGWEPPKRDCRAEEIWAASEPATELHPYVARKRGTPDGLRVLPHDHPLKIKGVRQGGALVVPAFDPSGKLCTLQMIGASKLNLAKHQFGDSMFIVGEPASAAPIYVCEGIGTAWACWRATGNASAVTFGVGRFRRVASVLQSRFPDSLIVLVPDRGVENDVGKVARALRLQMVTLPQDLPAKTDAADYADSHGDADLEQLLANHGEPIVSASDEAEPVTPSHETGERLSAAGLGDFYAYMPTHNYLFVPTRELWPSSSVNGRVRPWPKDAKGKDIEPAKWLDHHRPIEQMAWHPDEPQLIRDRILQVSGWVTHPGASVFNLYRAPELVAGNQTLAGPWLQHVHRIYPDEAAHIIRWLAHRVQRPGQKCNHALVLGGMQGIGKDTLLEPIKTGIGPWNWSDINPAQMLGRFNGWAKAVVVRINEARDLGDVDRFAFYDHSKVYIAAPPDVLRVDEKHLREHYVANVMGLIITTNHSSDGLYLPADDRRHFVAWSPCSREDFDQDYWPRIYRWFDQGGTSHVVAYLRTLDLSDFDPKAPPRKTPAFWNIVAAGEAPESSELRDVMEDLGNPDAVVLESIINSARRLGMHGLGDELCDRKNRRAIPHRMERIDFVPVRNPDADDGLFKVAGKRQAIYARRQLTPADQVRAARKVIP